MRKTRRGWAVWAWRVVAGGVCAWSLLWLFGGGWMLGDVILAFQAQALGAGLVVGVLALLCRRACIAGAIGVGLVIGAMPLVLGRSLAAPGVDLTRAPAVGTIRVVSCNIDPENPDWQADFDRITSWQPDVIILIEIPPDVWRAFVRRDELASTDWPYYARRAWVDELASPCFVLSRWPIEKIAFDDIPEADRDVLVAHVDHPDGAFRVGTIHPHSPRSLWRWRQGNRQIRTTEAALRRSLAASDEPYIAGVDLNSGPAGGRASVLRGTGLRMSKPIAGGWGSFPAGLPVAVRVQLDDVWRSEGVEVLGWSSPGGLSSDHRAVVVDVRFPG